MKNTLKYILVAVFATMFAAPAFADKDPKDAIKTKKNIIEDASGNIKLRLETFVTGDGENRSQMVTTVNPMDVVLVLDRSLSMDDAADHMKLGNANDSGFGKLCYDYKQAMPSITFWRSTATGSAEKVNVIKNNNGTYEFRRNISTNSLYTGDIYINKIDALKIGVNTFVDVVKTNAEENDANHKISVVTFGSSATNLLSLTDNYSAVKTTVNGISLSGTTDADLGMAAAETELNNNAREGSSRTVVFFTDGKADNENKALAVSLRLKNAGVTVYSIGVFPSNAGKDIRTFLYLMSSHNTTVATMPSSSAQQNYPSSKYYKLASNASELQDAFEEASKEIGQGGDSQADYVLETSSTVLRDIITPSFQIPDNGVVSFKVDSISTISGEDPEKVYSWRNSEVNATGVSYTKRVDGGKTYVDVKGYNFNDHWVGYIHKMVDGVEDVSKRTFHGQKLIIYIDIEPSAENEGGAMQTNAEGSGVLINGNEVVPFDQDPIQDYVNNDLVTVRQVNLTIKKSGLQPGESVIYVVTRNNDSSFKRTVVLTAGADGTAEGKAKVDAWPNANKSSLYTYTVTEDTTWAYEYKASSAQSHTLYDSSLKLTNVFTFGPSEESGKSSSSASRGEDAKNNVFSR